MQSMSARDEFVQQHFNRNTFRYVEQYREPHRQICFERLLSLKDYVAAVRSPFLLDIGGGGGALIDVFLKLYPEGTACCLDLSEEMLRANQPDSRKVLVAGTAKAIPLRAAAFDVINIDCLMHHMVDLAGYHCTISGIRGFLGELRNYLRPDGVVAIREIYHESPGLDNLGARLLFALSMTRVPPLLVEFLEKIGMHTANAGVCFLTRSQWNRVVSEAGYTVRALSVKPWRSMKLKACGFWNSGELYYLLTP
jgi:SAM-dependent methyltransferase